MCELETLPDREINTSMSTLPALHTLKDTLASWAIKGKGVLTDKKMAPTKIEPMKNVFL
jgi:hypothetical protein